MEVLQSTLDAIVKDGLDRFPLEACGYIVKSKETGKEFTIALANLAGEAYGEQMFIMDQSTIAYIKQDHDIVAIYHTHPHTSASPSLEDRIACKKSGLPWVIMNPYSKEVQHIVPSDMTYNIPLIGRKFTWGIFDCYALVQDYYKLTFDITLPDFDRGLLFQWNLDGWDRIDENFVNAGFVELPLRAKLKKGDVFLMNMGSDKINHCGVLHDPNRNVFYHHVLDRKSEASVYGGWYAQITRKVVRHSSLRF